MEESYPHPITVTGDWSPSLGKSMKNKLQIYFQSKKKSCGGDCQVEYDNPSEQRACVWFKTQETRERVLARQSHELIIDTERVTLSVRLKEEREETTSPGPERGTSELPESDVEKAAEEKKAGDEESLQTNCIVLENVQDKISKEILGMMVENICSVSEENGDFTVEMIYDINKAVVCFTNCNDVEQFLTECTKSKRFKQNQLRAEALELSRSVRVENLPPHTTEDLLELYFEKEKNGGGEVEGITILPEEGAAIVTFLDPKVPGTVRKQTHLISKVPVNVYPYYKSLGTALYGKDRPVWKLPDPFTESIHASLWNFLHANNQQVTLIGKHMGKHFCGVDLSSPTVKFSPLPALLKQRGLTAKHIGAWKENASEAFQDVMSKYGSFECPVNSSVWKMSEKEIRSAVTGAVILEPDMAKGTVAIAGLAVEVDKLRQIVVGVVDRVTKKIEREKNSVTEEVAVAPAMFHILQQDRLKEETAAKYPELILKYEAKHKKLILSGFASEVFNIKSHVLEHVLHMKQKHVEVHPNVVNFLREVDSEEMSYSLFTSKGISAVFNMQEEAVVIVGKTDEALADAEKKLQTELSFHCIDVEDRDVLRKPEWMQLVTSLKNGFNSQMKTVSIKLCELSGNFQMIVSGLCEPSEQVYKKLSGFIQKHSRTEVMVPVKSNAVIKFIQENKADSWVKDTSTKNVKISFDARRPRIILSGEWLYVCEVKTIFEKMVSSLHADHLKIMKPGVKKYFQEQGSVFMSVAMKENNFVVVLQEDSFPESEEEEAGQSVCEVQMSDGVVITVCKADICHYPVDVVVNASNEDLKHIGGLAAALLRAAGQLLQDQCDRYVNAKGRLKPGEAIITDSGRLPCKHVIHAVGPRFHDTDSRRAVCNLKRAVKECLKLAETHNCSSIAIPAISSGIFGFPLDLCAETIAQSVREHCQDFYGDNTLKKIHLVNNDDKTVRAVTAAVQKVFADEAPQQRGLQGKPQPKPKPVVDHRQFGKVERRGTQETIRTKEGLTITLRQGNIQDASTDVIVNTISEDLDLSKGAVSNAILQAAGSSLQTLVRQEAATSPFDQGDVVITRGCGLKCSMVFHAICPFWDQGKGKSEDLLKGIVKECLKQAEQRKQSSVSFPAIGTGNLGFPKPLVASLMLEQVLRFSQKWDPKRLQEVVFIVHPSDVQSVRDFTSEFRKQPHGRQTPVKHHAGPTQPGTAVFGKILTPTLGVYCMTIGGLTLEVLTGDITKETTDVIVNSSNNTFTLKSGVSKAILDAAGRSVEMDCLLLGSQTHDGIIMTRPGNLQCQKIVHIVGQSDPSNIKDTVKHVLQVCEEKRFTSVSFPALGTGQGGTSPSRVADAMISAVVDFVSKRKAGECLRSVRIVIFQAVMLSEFHKSLQAREGTALPEQKSVFSRVKRSSSETKENEEFVMMGEEFEPAVFQICAERSQDMARAKDWIKELIIKEQTEETINDKWIALLSREDLHKIQDLQKTLQVSIKVESRGPESSIQLAGLTRDVLKAMTEIQVMIRKVENKETQKREAAVVSTLVEWQYEDSGSFVPFNSLANLTLEQAFENKEARVKIKIDRKNYTVSLSRSVAVDDFNKKIKIKRVVLTDESLGNLPTHWSDMKGSQTVQVQIQTGTPEYQDVEQEFRKTCPNNILKIERIQNGSLWHSYQIRKKHLDEKNGHTNNERRLFHGTCPTTLSQINTHGFNRSYAGRNAAVIGNGTYFAVDANYSASNTYSKPDAQGLKYVYYSRVLVGEFTTGRAGLIVPPAKTSADPADLYDSVVDNPANPRVFVIFNDVQAYPEYLITFR
ncbi:protein mono-ADP-ribosyltransferase PARP14 isoform X2 [Amia ocellicauda]|uniref:protein mono-ADP-ribosyltransferase PARP14 isoform X2 n=1 Tax=Amia ocellicauda TaxID=2972642 RepID=UPI0034645450